MHRFTVGALLGAAFAAAAMAAPAGAPPAPAASDVDQVTRLERRVANLERQIRLQIQWNVVATDRITNASDRITNASSRIAAVENRQLSVTSAIGTSQFVAPRSWGSVSASCVSGTLVAGGMLAEWPMEIGQSELSGTTWRVSAFNPYTNDNAFLRGRGVCISLR
jgi:hypothetical protein